MANTGGRDFTIDLRMRADFDAARKAIRDTGKELDNLGEKAAQASTSASTGGGGSSADARAQQAYLRASQQTQAAVAAEIGLIGQLQDRLGGSASSWEALADTEAMLDKAMARGLITAEEYDDALAQLDKQHTALERTTAQQAKSLDSTVSRYDRAGAQLRRLEQDEAKLKRAVDAGRISREQYNRAMANIGAQRAAIQGLNQQASLMKRLSLQTAATQRDLTQLAIYSARGDWQLAGNQILQMGSRAGVASKLVSGLGLSVGVAAAAVATIGTAAYQAYTELRALETALISTGNAAGLTAGQLLDTRNAAAEATGEYGKAQQAAVQFVQSGQVGARALEDMISAAVNLSELTGKSIEQTTSEVLQLAKAPVAGLIELDKQYNFLTTSTLEQVRALQDQGREQEALRVGVAELASVHRTRVQEMREGAAGLARAWNDAQRNFRSYWNDFKTFVNASFNPTIENEISFLENRLASPDAGKAWKRAAQTRLDALRKEQQGLEELAAGTAFANDLRREGVEAFTATTDALKAAQSPAEQLDAAIEKVRKRYITLKREVEQGNISDSILDGVIFGTDGSVSGGNFDKEVAALRSKILPKTKSSGKSDAQQAEEAARRELDNLAKQASLLGEVELGERKVSEAARIRYEVEDGAYRDASAVTKEALLDYAQLVDGEQQRVDAAKQYVQVQLEIARLQGRPVPPELDQEAKELQKLAQYYDNMGKAAEAANTRKLLSMRQASQELDVLQAEYQRVIASIELARDRILASVQTGLITEAEGRRQVVELYRTQGAALDELLPKMEALARATGNEQALAGIQRMRFELDQMRRNTDLLQQSLANTFEGSLGTALESLANGTASLSEAGRQFFLDMASGMARFAAEQLAAIARAKILAALSKQQEGEGNGQSNAAETAASAAAMAAAGIAVSAGGQAVKSGAGDLTTASVGLLGAGLVVRDAAKDLYSAAIAMAASSAVSSYSSGGYTGHGGKYQIAGLVHAGEFVNRQEVVRQPGALAFLTDFNRVGMEAIDRWRGFADGGYVPPLAMASRVPALSLSSPDQVPAVVNNRMRIYLAMDADQLAQRIANHPTTEKKIIAVVSENGGAIRGEWGA